VDTTLIGIYLIKKYNSRFTFCRLLFDTLQVKSSQVTFIYIALFTIQIVSKQLHSDNKKVVQHRSIIKRLKKKADTLQMSAFQFKCIFLNLLHF